MRNSSSEWEAVAEKAGSSLKGAEKDFLDEASKEKPDPAKLEVAKMKYQTAMRVFEAIQEGFKAFNDTIRGLIQKLSGNS